jgi:2',3'-cyclic-nucleotide 2'-phosphodiesterase/3'-nucleotidase
MPGLWGSHLGVIDLALERANGRWAIAASRSEARPIAARDENGAIKALTGEDQALAGLVAPAHDRTLGVTRREVAHSPVGLHSYFAPIGVDTAARAVMRAQAWAVRAAIRGTPQAGLPVLSAASAFKAGGRGGPDFFTDVAPGPMTMRDLSDLYLYTDSVVALHVTGADLRGWLERAASVFNHVPLGAREVPLLDTDHPVYLLDAIDGLEYGIDLAAPPRFDVQGHVRDPDAWRVRALAFGGKPVEDADRFILACNSHRGLGGGRFPGSGAANLVIETAEPMRDTILRFVTAGGLGDLPCEPLFRLSAAPGSSVSFSSGPGARAHLGDVPFEGLAERGKAQDGFLRFELTF